VEARNRQLAAFLFAFGLIYIAFLNTEGFRLVRERGEDFPSYYFGARMAFQSSVSPYEASNWRDIPLEYAGDNQKFYPYLYAPPSLLAFWPLTPLDYDAARILFLWISHATLLLALGILMFGILRLRIGEALSFAVVIYALACSPVALTLQKGQTNLIVLLCILLAWHAVRTDKGPAWAALPLTLAVVLKLTPALFLIPMWLAGRRRHVMWSVVTLAAVSAASYLLLPSGTWQSWYANVGSQGYAQTVGSLSLSTPANQSVNGMLDRLFYGRNVRFEPLLGGAPEVLKRWAVYAACAAIAAIALATSWRARRRSSPESIDMDFALWAATGYLIAPISWDHHLVLVMPAIFVLLKSVLQTPRPWPALAALGIVGVFLALPFNSNNPAFRDGARQLLMSMQLYAVIVLWAMLLGARWLPSPRLESAAAVQPPALA
jgi:hypothetical protein